MLKSLKSAAHNEFSRREAGALSEVNGGCSKFRVQGFNSVPSLNFERGTLNFELFYSVQRRFRIIVLSPRHELKAPPEARQAPPIQIKFEAVPRISPAKIEVAEQHSA